MLKAAARGLQFLAKCIQAVGSDVFLEDDRVSKSMKVILHGIPRVCWEISSNSIGGNGGARLNLNDATRSPKLDYASELIDSGQLLIKTFATSAVRGGPSEDVLRSLSAMLAPLIFFKGSSKSKRKSSGR